MTPRGPVRRNIGPLLTRRRLLQAAAVLGGTGVVSTSAWSRVCATEPDTTGRFEQFVLATETPVTPQDVAVWTSTGSVERGQPLTIKAVSQRPWLDVWIHRVGGPDEAVWECGRAWVVDGMVAEVVADWPSGLYLVSAAPPGGTDHDDVVAFHPFVVTDQNSTASITVQVPLSTYHAYNAWTPDGIAPQSLYDFNSASGRAMSVSLDRPYDGFDGAGFLFFGDHQLAEWLNTEGVDVNYTSSWDTHHRPELLDRTRLFISNFHDEYWSRRMRSNFQARVDSGMNAAFFGANNMYWQVDIEGTTMACDKKAGGPQGTFRSVDEPEADTLGAQFESYRHPYGLVAADWIVAGSDHWAYAGTGLDDGDVIERLVGYEWDRIPNDDPAEGVTVLASSPISTTLHHHATMVERAGKGTVFNAGTNYWPRLLTGGGHWPASDAVQRITRNLITTLG